MKFFQNIFTFTKKLIIIKKFQEPIIHQIYQNNNVFNELNFKHIDINLLISLYEKKPNNLVLDLDETLIHSNIKQLNSQGFKIFIESKNQIKTYYLHKRQYLEYFLINSAKNYNIYIYTSSQSNYAEEVIKHIDPLNIIKKIFAREYCLVEQNVIKKDLRLLNIDLDRTIMIDNLEANVYKNNQNCIKINDFLGDFNDCELIRYSQILDQIYKSNLNMQQIIKQLQI
ncbi:hypothetical protein IMG5_055200 [Ichthyophthirius multifiliis]|uniref:Mitochondrial import inner membrane translocase subunit TIM50 n=1 Tax=Ichthyophthirius multifiliis TaxID=5932 RepID=G0QN48_ICHMU|nr:hypothetical protein IMG5_055200 [Ichthyophthirius multifiliis]EGR33377.1 hypothetical protein IMG5_055200 [Ichthyophthirius multifiliis]|eukprot:XP_004037363.1 hypothetical protein IMG5_055200 [Ichthyophthirius multifiliis]